MCEKRRSCRITIAMVARIEWFVEVAAASTRVD
jgi:hypothetical protein